MAHSISHSPYMVFTQNLHGLSKKIALGVWTLKYFDIMELFIILKTVVEICGITVKGT
jgi:hypothetical protein